MKRSPKKPAKPAAEQPIPYRPAAPPIAGPLFPCADPLNDLPEGVDLFPNIRTLADLGLTEARTYALSTHTHCSSRLRFNAMLKRSRPLLNTFGFAVTLVHLRDEEEEHGEVIVWRHEHGREGWHVGGYGIGTIDLSTGRFVDNLELSEREWHETTPDQAEAAE